MQSQKSNPHRAISTGELKTLSPQEIKKRAEAAKAAAKADAETKLAAKAAEKPEANGNGNGATWLLKQRRAAIVMGFTPSVDTVDAAIKNTAGALRLAARNENEQISNNVASLALAMADTAWFLLSGDKSLPAMTADKSFPSALIRFLKSRDEVNKVIPVHETLHGNVVVIDHISLFESVSPATLRKAAVRAALYAYKAETKVSIGYLPTTEAQGSRFTRLMRWNAAKPEGESYKALCIPRNVVVPHLGTPRLSEDGTKSILKDLTPNTDESLRYLDDEWAAALFAHFFDAQPLVYDLSAAPDTFPSGQLIVPKAVRQVRGAASNYGQESRSTEAIAAAALKTQGNTLPAALFTIASKAAAFPSKGGAILGCTDEPGNRSGDVATAALVCARSVIDNIIVPMFPDKVPQGTVAAELVELFNILSTFVDYDGTSGEFYWIGRNGDRVGKIAPTAKAINPTAATWAVNETKTTAA